MGLDTKSNISLWKDFAMVELNYAVMYSFQVQWNPVNRLANNGPYEFDRRVKFHGWF